MAESAEREVPPAELVDGTERGIPIVALVGDWDLAAAVRLRDRLDRVVASDVTVDLRRTTFVDSTIISVLVNLQLRFRAEGRSATLRLPEGGIIRRVFEMMALEARRGSRLTGPAPGQGRWTTLQLHRGASMDILTLLKNDHEAVGELLDRAMKLEGDDARFAQLAARIESALTLHAKLEERLFYTPLRERSKAEEAKTDVFEAYAEHDVLKHLIGLLKSEKRRDEAFKAELQVLGENVKHHVKEEESTIFALARELLSEDDREKIGAEFEAAKAEAAAA
ncbi:MAG: hemerythrin domain-containing protein [Candidatus Eremiobacteraeota bacterium]|nr:hemerythrin domain-containing protein [Candidatus Eremiobacteraeota bacterium]